MVYSKLKQRINQDDYFHRAYILLKQLSIILILFQLCRLAFFIVNYDYFFPIKNKYILSSFLYGVQYDISAIIKYNCIYIILALIPNRLVFGNSYYRWLLNTLFILFNCTAILLNVVDIEYFKFANKRTTYEFVYYLKTMDIELLKLLPTYTIQYWYMLIAYVSMSFFIIQSRFKKDNLTAGNINQVSRNGKVAIFVILILLLGVTARGPGKSSLRSSDIDRIMPIEYGALVTNTPFMIIEVYSRQKDTDSFTGSDPGCQIDTEKHYNSSVQMTRQNVVIIILESFSREYIGNLNDNKGSTPFLDSLISQSYVCRNAFANGRSTLQALPAILCSLPSLGEMPVTLSVDKEKSLNSIAEILNSEGYNSSFFYGARNGNLGINNFARQSGFQNYFGMNESGKCNADSPWGIFDDEFLQFASKEIDSFREPFLACILTLSSHSPFVIPKKFQNKFLNQATPQLRSVAYTDYCLEHFFKEVAKSKWYPNTLFIITADHASYSYSVKYNSKIGIFSIPILYFHPNDLKLRGSSEDITQQLDIKPTILDYLHYQKKFISLGNSIFSHSQEHFAVMKFQNQYQYIDNNFLIDLGGNGELLSAYKIKEDNLLLNNLSDSHTVNFDKVQCKLKAIIKSHSDD